jgi:hypothetical protein
MPARRLRNEKVGMATGVEASDISLFGGYKPKN